MGRVVRFDFVDIAWVDAGDCRHGGIDVVHQVGAAFGDGKIVVARTNVEHGGGAGRRGRVVHDDGIDLVVCERVKEGTASVDFFIGAGNAFVGEPLLANEGLHDAGVATDSETLERLGVTLGQIVAIGLGVDVVALGALGVRGKEQLLGAFLGVGDVGHEVDFACLEHVHKLGEGAGDVFVPPAGRVVRQGLEVLVTPSRETLAGGAVLEALVVDEPADADRFDLLIGVGGKGRGGRDGAQYGERGKRGGQGATYN